MQHFQYIPKSHDSCQKESTGQDIKWHQVKLKIEEHLVECERGS